MMYFFGGNPHKDFAVVKSERKQGKDITLEKIDVSSIDLSKKSIIILCGNNSKSQRKAEHYAYICRSWLKNTPHKYGTTTYSIYYPNEQPLFNANPYFNLDYNWLAKTIFYKAIFKNNQIQSVDEIKKNLSNVVFFGHSAGGYVMNELMHNLGQILTNLHFSRADIRNIFSSIVFIAYSPYMLVQAPIKSIYVAPMYDTMGSTKLVYKHILRNRNVISSVPDLDIFGEKRLTERANDKFIRRYKEQTCGENTIYFLEKNAIISTPNLLYYDGQKEDHNLAGVINYGNKNINQTKAGKLTANFLCNAFDYSLSTNREEFNIQELYKQTIKMKDSDEVFFTTTEL